MFSERSWNRLANPGLAFLLFVGFVDFGGLKFVNLYGLEG